MRVVEITIILIVVLIVIVMAVAVNESNHHDKNMVDAGNFDFYWENRGDYHDIDPNKQYVLYYRGMFAPPTKGHFSVVERFAKYPNVKILIVQMGNERRHGVEHWLNEQIWKMYIDELLPRDRVHLINSRNFDMRRYLKGIDTILYVRGYEDDLSDNERKYERQYRKWVRDADMEFVFMDRSVTNISASKFVQSLIRYRRLSPLRRNSKSMNEVLFYIPDQLSMTSKKYVVNELIKMDLR